MFFLKWVYRLNKILTSLLGLTLIVMTVVVFLQVIVRFVFTAFDVYISAAWTEELARYLMIWVVFIGGAVATRHAKMLAVDALVYAVPSFPGKLIKIVAHVLSLIFYGCIFVIGIQWINQGLTIRAPVMGISMVYLYSAMSVGAGLMILNTVTLFIDVVINKKDIRGLASTDVEDSAESPNP